MRISALFTATLVTTSALALTCFAAPVLAQTVIKDGPMAGPGPKMIEMHQIMMRDDTTKLSLSASGEVSATPDMATVSFGVVTKGDTASDAMKANNVRMNAVMAALKSAGIAPKDIQTSSLNLNPQYVYADNQAPRLTGYQAQNQISVRVNDLAQTGPVIDTVIKAGINQIDSIAFGLKNDAGLLDEARKQAIKTLTGRAELYAAATGTKVKAIREISEGGPIRNDPMPMAGLVLRKADASTPVSAGELQMSVEVSAVFDLVK